MLEESEAAEVIRKQQAISFAPRPIPRELPDPQTGEWGVGVGAQAEVRRRRTLSTGTGSESSAG